MTITSQGLSDEEKDLYAEIQNRGMTEEELSELRATQADIVKQAMDLASNKQVIETEIAEQTRRRILQDRRFNPNA